MNWTIWKSGLGKIAQSAKRIGTWCQAHQRLALITSLVIAALLFATGAFLLWEWLNKGGNGSGETNSATLRNVGLLFAGALALVFALWRAQIANRQADTAERGLLNERYQKGAEMLGSQVLSVRVGAVYTLGGLAKDYPDQYHDNIMNLLFSFVRSPIIDSKQPISREIAAETYRLREDVQSALDVIDSCRKHNSKMEKIHPSRHLTAAKLRGAYLAGYDLSHVDLSLSDLRDANLTNAILNKAGLYDTQLTGARLYGITGMTQYNLDYADVDPDRLPSLEGAVDCDSHEPLFWDTRYR